MREIKFRIWDKGRREMITNSIDYEMRCLEFRGPKKHEASISIGFADYWWERFEFMQYTGLKDKNEMEIYEGDVVKTQNCHFEDEGVYTVKWADGECGFWLLRGMLHCGLSESELEALHLEVIGNIHENPELLKE